MLKHFLISTLTKIGLATYSCSHTDYNFPYFLGNSEDILIAQDLCLSSDKNIIGMVGQVGRTIPGPHWMGSNYAGLFAVVENSLDMNELAIFSFWDGVGVEN